MKDRSKSLTKYNCLKHFNNFYKNNYLVGQFDWSYWLNP